MNIFNLFGQNKQQDDPYWEFDKTKHFRPKLNRGEFFKLTGFDFGWFVLEPISEYIQDRKGELLWILGPPERRWVQAEQRLSCQHRICQHYLEDLSKIQGRS